MPHPNILFLCTDQLRYDCTGPSGSGRAQTPHVDRLASQGMWFSHAYTPIPTCCPARQSLLSGLWPDRHGGLWNYDIFLPVRLFEAPTWTEALHDAGYRMDFIGKWHVHPTRTPLDFGYDTYLDVDAYGTWRSEQGLPDYVVPGAHWFGGHDPGPTEASRPFWLADQAIQRLETYAISDQPWHLRLDLVEPHIPCCPTQPFLDLYADEALRPWGNFPDPLTGKPYIQHQMRLSWGLEDYTWADWQPVVHRYLAMVSQTDAALGRVLDALDRLGLTENTVVIFTSDHGDACGSHGFIDKHYVLYDEVVRVPLLIRWPDHVAANTRSDAFVVHALDVASTCCDLAGVPIPDGFQGDSLLPLLQGNTPESWRDAAYSTYNGQQFGLYNQRMIRTYDWKYIWNPTDVDELYDLTNDPSECHNRIADPACGSVLKNLRHRLLAHLQERADPIVKKPFILPQLTKGRKHVR